MRTMMRKRTTRYSKKMSVFYHPHDQMQMLPQRESRPLILQKRLAQKQPSLMESH